MTENLVNEHCRYCKKNNRLIKQDTDGCVNMNYVRSDQNNEDIDHRIVLFGWRLRLATGNEKVSVHF